MYKLLIDSLLQEIYVYKYQRNHCSLQSKQGLLIIYSKQHFQGIYFKRDCIFVDFIVKWNILKL